MFHVQGSTKEMQMALELAGKKSGQMGLTHCDTAKLVSRPSLQSEEGDLKQWDEKWSVDSIPDFYLHPKYKLPDAVVHTQTHCQPWSREWHNCQLSTLSKINIQQVFLSLFIFQNKCMVDTIL